MTDDKLMGFGLIPVLCFFFDSLFLFPFQSQLLINITRMHVMKLFDTARPWNSVEIVACYSN